MLKLVCCREGDRKIMRVVRKYYEQRERERRIDREKEKKRRREIDR